jgi:hypothetical protein
MAIEFLGPRLRAARSLLPPFPPPLGIDRARLEPVKAIRKGVMQVVQVKVLRAALVTGVQERTMMRLALNSLSHVRRTLLPASDIHYRPEGRRSLRGEDWVQKYALRV